MPLLLLIIIFCFCDSITSANTPEEYALDYLSGKTGLPVSVLSKITTVKSYDLFDQLYITLLYSEVAETEAVGAGSDPLILLAVYIDKYNNTVTDAQNNSGDRLFTSINSYSKGMTADRFYYLNQRWEKMFGPSDYWQYDVLASFELLYHVRPAAGYLKQYYTEEQIAARILDIPEAALPDQNVLPYHSALELSKQSLKTEYGLDMEQIDKFEYGSSFKKDNNTNQVSQVNDKEAHGYWVFTFYSGGVRCYACQILYNGTVQQIIRFSEDGKGVIYNDGIYY